MPEKTRTLVADIYDAWRAQDLDWLGTYLPDDFSHLIHLPPGSGLGGLRKGKEAVIRRWRLLLETYEIVRFDTRDLIFDKNHAAGEIPLDYKHRRTGKMLTTTKASFWRLEEGWPVRLTEYYDVTHVQAFFDAVAVPA